MTTTSPFKTLADVKAANEAIGNWWFSKETMRFWKSKFESGLIAGRYFITSEDEFVLDGRTPKRVFAVRYANDDGSIQTLKSYLPDKAAAKFFISEYKRKVAQ